VQTTALGTGSTSAREGSRPASGRRRRSLGARCSSHAWKSALVLAIAAAGLWTATHGVAGVAWADVLVVLRQVTVWHLLLLALIWLGGLGIYSLVLAAALPGLGMRRGLLLNLSGSAVANVVPLGGAVATALNWRMVRRWGHSNLAFVAFCALTNALDVTSKLVLPLVAVTALVAFSVHVPTTMWVVAAVCVAALLVVAAVPTFALRYEGEEVDGARWQTAIRRHLREPTAMIRTIFLDQWARLVPGSACYLAAQVALLFFSLRSVGVQAPVTAVLMAAAIERLGSLVPITPGGTGVAEIGTIAWLVATGQDPAKVVAGVLLYRIFLIAMEIPVGGAMLGAWAWFQRSGSISAQIQTP
jgi:putative heme transporter